MGDIINTVDEPKNEELAEVKPVEPLPDLGVKIGDQIILRDTGEKWQIESIAAAPRGPRYVARLINIDRPGPKLAKDVGELVERLSEEGSAWRRV